jgi:hypothetical protein
MLIILFLFVTIKCVKISLLQLDKIKNKYLGYDERPINETIINIYEFKKNYEKIKLLEKLRSPHIIQENKVKLIYESGLFDELDVNRIKVPNVSKGLDF